MHSEANSEKGSFKDNFDKSVVSNFSSGYRIVTIMHSTGEKSPILIERNTGLPHMAANEWKLTRRTVTRSHLTLRQELFAVALLLDLAGLYRWKLDECFDKGRGLSPAQIGIVKEKCWLWRSDISRGVSESSPVALRTYKFRIDTIRAFCLWYLDSVWHDKAGDLADTKNQAIVYNIARHERTLTTADTTSPGRVGLGDSRITRMFEILNLKSDRNPFQVRLRLRNLLIVQILVTCGLRRAELLLLKLSDVHYRAGRAEVEVRRNPDEKIDKRDDLAVKTRERRIPIGSALARLLKHYIRHDRAILPKALRTPFIFLSDEGTPLGSDGFQYIFKKIADCDRDLQGITGHLLRHSWADQIKAHAEKSIRQGDLPEELAKLAINYLGGWTAQSQMAARYSQAFLESRANDIQMATSQHVELAARNEL